MQIGEKIRKKRISAGIKLIEIAKQTGYSQSYISQIERGIVNPSVVAMQKIADSFGLPTAYFFESSNPVTTSPDITGIVRKRERKGLLYPGSNIIYQLLSPDLQGKIEFLNITAPPGSSTGDEPFIHEGQEWGVILKGTMEIWVKDVRYILEEGDSITFDSSHPHRWTNCGHNELIAVWVVTPPSF
ncbi:Transcriptional regulator, MerR family [Desulfosporosinus sp. I2]|uniref:helix-turn-helix domain-containing protein n=1 Tax=Desulfosporosinus sp. I2 TaxID=1617025 RepID=UPI0005EE0579|nr:cupin domain-containing protein [Desulfosporosinus sp. I2]KJR48071.1 Transcriptional regulator, MerR family [Desulfosporosinus sp. I2]